MADDTAADDDHVSRGNAGDASEEDAAAAVRGFKILRAHLDGHAAGHFAHRGEEGQGTVGFADGFISHRVDPRLEEFGGEIGQRRQMEVGEQRQAGTEVGNLGGLRLLHLDDEVGFGPDVGGAVDHHGSGGNVVGVGNGAAQACAGLHQDFVAVLPQRGDAARNQGDSSFAIFDFFGYANNH